ncbi:hypothetical protein BDZ89DRAFT_949982 [Hymenopellis radicata]|nr:hypothetical protein BDZ89DRAFT_949982 [Hymenopellis radicata]
MRQLQKRNHDLANAADILRQSRFRSKEQFLRRFQHKIQLETYEPGNLVLVRNSAVEMNLNQFKTTDRYKGPYQIIKRTTRGNYVLAEMNNTTLR